MSKASTTLIVVALVVVIVAMSAFSMYNGLVTKDEGVSTAWADLQSQYQRRSDLIPNLVSTVKGYAKHESETLEGVV
ncbi:MAG: LemA family protein, partial [Bacteroidaceae bacterium]|nr:LemA family protein [Bacteroidaceae bacterium]